MKKNIALALTILCFFILSSCKCEHTWVAAMCTHPKTCSECGETEGDVIEHSWVAATCMQPKTCSKCGATGSEPRGHQWTEATCETPLTCSICGTTDGDAVGHTWLEATYDMPKNCDTCGVIEGDPVPVVQAVEQVYHDALAFAKECGRDQNYSYILLHDELFTLLANTSINKYNEDSVEKFFGEVESEDEAIMLLTKTLTYIVSEGDDYLSALMRKFSTTNSVTGVISTTSIDIEVADVALLMDELHIKPDVLGRILAMLDIYDYTWMLDSSEPLLQFTERGFKYKWESLTKYILDLHYQGAPLTAQDFIIRIVDEDSEDMDAIEYFKNSGWADGILAIFDDKNMDESDDDYYVQILTDRGIYVGSTLDTVLMAYGQTELYEVEKDGIPNAKTFKKNLDSDAYMAKLFERQCDTYVIYSYQAVYDICICFGRDKTVSWIIYFYNS